MSDSLLAALTSLTVAGGAALALSARALLDERAWRVRLVRSFAAYRSR